MGVASGYGYPEASVASGWNLWVWLECIGVVSGCCCKDVYRFPHNTFLQQHPFVPPSFFVHFLNVFLFLFYNME